MRWKIPASFPVKRENGQASPTFSWNSCQHNSSESRRRNIKGQCYWQPIIRHSAIRLLPKALGRGETTAAAQTCFAKLTQYAKRYPHAFLSGHAHIAGSNSKALRRSELWVAPYYCRQRQPSNRLSTGGRNFAHAIACRLRDSRFGKPHGRRKLEQS